MQVFVCHESMALTASILDAKRLNKQIVEAFQLLTDRLPNLHHPAYLYWKEHKEELRNYLWYMCREYTRRYGREHKCSVESVDTGIDSLSFLPDFDVVLLSHRVNLLRKDFNHYSQFFLVDDYESCPEGYYWNAPYGKSSRKSTEEWKTYVKD